MNERDRKFMAVYDWATSLAGSGVTRTFADGIVWLNGNGFTTSYGTPYVGERGVARVVHAAYYYVKDEMGLGEDGAAVIAKAFTDRNGAYAHE